MICASLIMSFVFCLNKISKLNLLKKKKKNWTKIKISHANQKISNG